MVLLRKSLGKDDEGPSQYQFVGSEITFNQCYPYDVKKFSKIKVCGAAVKLYLPNRCEAYSRYVEEVDRCTGAIVTDRTEADNEANCMEVSIKPIQLFACVCICHCAFYCMSTLEAAEMKKTALPKAVREV